MQHVDDALLIAYADDALAPAERGAVEAHLVSCAECRARVDEERALAQRASAVLGIGAPDAAVVPSFDDVLRRTGRSDATSSAAITTQRPTRRSFRPLALAATLIVALGAGWIARTLFLSPAFNAPEQRTEAAADDAARSAARSEQAEPGEQPPLMPDQAVTPGAADTDAAPAERQSFEALEEVGAEADAQQSQVAVVPPAPSAAAPPAADTSASTLMRRMADSAAGARADVVAERVVAVAPAPPPPPPSAPAPAQQKAAVMESATAVRTVTAPGEVAAADAEWQGTSAAAAAGRGTVVRGVPDAPVEVVWVGRSTAPWRARVVQRIDGAAVEIVEWRALGAGTAGSEGTLPDGRSYVFTTSGSALLRLRADLPLARLRAVAGQIAPLE